MVVATEHRALLIIHPQCTTLGCTSAMHPDCQSDCMFTMQLSEGERLGRPLTTSTENVMRQHTYDGNSGVVVGAMWG